MIKVKYTGTTEYFEYYYGDIFNNENFATSYYYRPSRYYGEFKTRKTFNNKILADVSITALCKKIEEQLNKGVKID